MSRDRLIAAVPATCLALLAASAFAEPEQARDYCASRPGLGTTPCTIAPGRVSVETGLVDWQRDDTPEERTDKLAFADTVVRVGVTDSVELVAEWTAVGRERSRDKASGTVETASGVGDLTLGAKLNLANPEGSGVSFAVQPFVTAPIGRTPIGAGGWAGGILVPVSVELSDSLKLEAQPEVDRLANIDEPGHHWAYSGTVGLEADLGGDVATMIEFQAEQDDEPGDRATAFLGALSVGWMASDDLQLDIGTMVGLNRNAPDFELYAGISRRF